MTTVHNIYCANYNIYVILDPFFQPLKVLYRCINGLWIILYSLLFPDFSFHIFPPLFCSGFTDIWYNLWWNNQCIGAVWKTLYSWFSGFKGLNNFYNCIHSIFIYNTWTLYKTHRNIIMLYTLFKHSKIILRWLINQLV